MALLPRSAGRRAILLVLLIPFINGAICGVISMLYMNRQAAKQVHDYEFELSLDQDMESFALPGLPIMDYIGPPFHVTQLRSHNWYRKLNLTRCPMEPGSPVTIYTVGSLDDLCVTKANARHHWVYMTYVSCPDCDAWDRAFVDLVDHFKETSPANDASLQYVKCFGSPFLCDMWGSDGPALLHISPQVEQCIENPAATFRQKNRQDGSDMICPVSVRLIDLPLKRYPGTVAFPTPLQQFLWMTEDSEAYTMIPEYDSDAMRVTQWNTHLDGIAANFALFAVVLKTSDFLNGLPSPIGPILDMEETIGMTVAQILSGLTINIGRFMFNLVQSMFRSSDQENGTATKLDPVPEQDPTAKPVNETEELMRYMMNTFITELKKNMTADEHAKFLETLNEFAKNRTDVFL